MFCIKNYTFVNLLLLFIFSLSLPVISMSSEKDTYGFSWLDPDKEVYVLQNRKFRKVSSPYVNLGYAITTSGAFVDAHAFQGRLGYFFVEEFGFEVIYSKNSGEENTTAKSVRNEGGVGSTPFRRITDNYMGGMVLWAPFYSKINTFNTIVYMDWIFGLGLAKIEETNNRPEFETSNFGADFVTETHTGPMWNVGAKFYINKSFSLRIDMTTIHYQAKAAKTDANAGDSWYTNYDLGLSIGYNF